MIDPLDEPTKGTIRSRAVLRTLVPDLRGYYYGLRELPPGARPLAYLAMVSPFLGLALLAVVLAIF